MEMFERKQTNHLKKPANTKFCQKLWKSKTKILPVLICYHNHQFKETGGG